MDKISDIRVERCGKKLVLRWKCGGDEHMVKREMGGISADSAIYAMNKALQDMAQDCDGAFMLSAAGDIPQSAVQTAPFRQGGQR